MAHGHPGTGRDPVPDAGSFSIYAGDDWSAAFAFSSDVGGTLTPEDLAGWTDWEAQWRPYPSAGEIIALAVTVDGHQVTITATAAQTHAMSASRTGVFDVQAVAADGRVRTFVRGSTTQTPDVTR